MKGKKLKLEMRCSHCGSTNVRRDADVIWDAEAQQWTVGGIFDNATCDDCGGETKINEVPVSDPRAQILAQYDGIEVKGIRVVNKGEPDQFEEPVEDGEKPDFYAVYWHCKAGGVECIGDCVSAQDARAFAEKLVALTGFEVMDEIKAAA